MSIPLNYLKTLSAFPVAYHVKSKLTVLVVFLRAYSIRFNKESFELLLLTCLRFSHRYMPCVPSSFPA